MPFSVLDVQDRISHLCTFIEAMGRIRHLVSTYSNATRCERMRLKYGIIVWMHKLSLEHSNRKKEMRGRRI